MGKQKLVKLSKLDSEIRMTKFLLTISLKQLKARVPSDTSIELHDFKFPIM